MAISHASHIHLLLVSMKEEERETINSGDGVKVCVRGKMRAR
jgi:hypothetical protein